MIKEKASTLKTDGEGMGAVFREMLGGAVRAVASALGFENVGFVLAVVTKTARMLFVRESVLMAAQGASGALMYCHDKWEDSSSADSTYALGVKCKDADPRPDAEDSATEAVKSNFEFEFAELVPVWNAKRKRNEMQVAIRGGYNLQFCRTLAADDTKSECTFGRRDRRRQRRRGRRR